MVNELRIRFHRRMDEIDEKIIQLFALVSEDILAATEEMLSGESSLGGLLDERERTIDAVLLEVEETLNEEFALQAPAARDLRFLLSALRIVPELERSHDLVVHIARHAAHGLRDELTPRSRGLVGRMGDVAADMWRQAADCWRDRDGSVATVLDERDEDLDGLHAALMAELASGPVRLPVAMDMTLVARFYERLGDHAVNIAKRVPYMAGRPGGDEPETA